MEKNTNDSTQTGKEGAGRTNSSMPVNDQQNKETGEGQNNTRDISDLDQQEGTMNNGELGGGLGTANNTSGSNQQNGSDSSL